MGKKGKKKAGGESKGEPPQDQQGGGGEGSYDAFDFQEPTQELRRPSTQLELTEVQLAEAITCVLEAKDPNKSDNNVEYSFKKREYGMLPEPQGVNMAVHFTMDGGQLHTTSDEWVELSKQKEEDVRAAEDARREAAA